QREVLVQVLPPRQLLPLLESLLDPVKRLGIDEGPVVSLPARHFPRGVADAASIHLPRQQSLDLLQVRDRTAALPRGLEPLRLQEALHIDLRREPPAREAFEGLPD